MAKDKMKTSGVTDSSGTSSVSYPDWVDDAAQHAVGRAREFFDTPYQQYPGQRVAPMSADSTGALNDLRDLRAPGASTERIVDENGRLGRIADYMNPYIGAALDPALREMDTRSTQERLRIGNARVKSGAFGDLRHGVLEGEQAQRATTAVGDVTARTYAGGYESAMAQRGSDLQRFEQSALSGFQSKIQEVQARLAGGQLTQQQAQNELDAQYSEYMRAYQDQYDKLQAYTGALSGVPVESTTTGTERSVTQEPRGHPFLKALGSLAGSAMGMFSFAGSDIRLKEDITRIGTTKGGHPLYTFRYKDGDGTVQTGVMAHEVLRTQPEAVRVGANGFYEVDYAQIH